mgnify:CR=1 FL=1
MERAQEMTMEWVEVPRERSINVFVKSHILIVDGDIEKTRDEGIDIQTDTYLQKSTCFWKQQF